MSEYPPEWEFPGGYYQILLFLAPGYRSNKGILNKTQRKLHSTLSLLLKSIMAPFSFNSHLKSYWLDWNWGEQNLETQRRSPAKHSTSFWETRTNFATVKSDGTCLCAGGDWRLQPSARAMCCALLGQYCQEWQARWKRKLWVFSFSSPLLSAFHSF